VVGVKAITLWQPWASLCVLPRNPRFEERHRIEGASVSCQHCNRTFTFNMMRDRGPHLCSCTDAVAARRDAERPVKSIETRSWAAPRSLIGQRIAIHAAKTSKPWRELDAPSLMVERETIQAVLGALGVMNEDGSSWPSPFITEDAIEVGDVVLPLGAVVGTAVLADCVPIVDQHTTGTHLLVTDSVMMIYDATDPARNVGLADQEPYGHFAPGRWAWVLVDVDAFAEPVPATGRQGLWEWGGA
jgi:hypothetical protein